MNRRPAFFLLLYMTGTLYLSLFPWQFIPNLGSRTLIWIPLVTRRTILDAVLNVVFYIPLGAAAFASFRHRTIGAIAALTLGTLVSFSVEWTQLSIPTRFGNLTDLFCNIAGTFLGVVAAFAATNLAPRLRELYWPGVLLAGVWAVWQAFTFLPRYGPTVNINHEVVGLLLLALVAARKQVRPAVPLALLWLMIEELRPFRFQRPPQPFWWLPFKSWFEGAPETYYGIFFGKLFLYTAILRVERNSGIRWAWALAAPALILAAGESAQRYLPGRTPEITDLVLLAAGAGLLKLAEPYRDH